MRLKKKCANQKPNGPFESKGSGSDDKLAPSRIRSLQIDAQNVLDEAMQRIAE